MKHRIFFRILGMALGMSLLVLLSSCNPQCDSPFTVVVKSPVNAMGSEILLQASNPIFTDQLRSRAVYVNNQPLSSENIHFVEGLGLIVRMPSDLEGNVNLEVEDYDCGPLGIQVAMEDPSFFINNPNYILPSPPDIVIPVAPPSFPPDITNAWISPQNPDYCLWFGPYKEYPLIKNGTLILTDTTRIVASGSFELSTCGNTDAYYFNNPFFGIVDTINNYIELTIDRSAKEELTTLKVEHFTGQFIDIDQSGYAMQPTPTTACSSNPKLEKKHDMMCLLSRETGRLTIIFKLAL